MNAEQTADQLARQLGEFAEPTRAESERAYLKSNLEHMGVPVPAVRRLVRGVVRANPVLTADDVVDLVDALWVRPVHEMRVAFERRGRTMHRMLSAIPGVRCLEPEGAFYCFPNVTGLLGRGIRGRRATTSAELAEIVIDEKLHAKGRFVGKLPFGTHAWVATAPDHVERRGTFDVDEDTAARLG